MGKSQKSGFEDLITLHAYIDEPSSPTLVGTEFILNGLQDAEIEQAKKLFLKFNDIRVIEETRFGQVLSNLGNSGGIFINGVLVANEDNFLFSYNITSLNAAIKKAMNRERTNVGRTAYANTVKSILLECNSQEVAESLSADLSQYSYGSNHDELKWIDIQQHAAKILNNFKKVVFVTAEDIERGTDIVNEARLGGFDVVTIPNNLRDKIAEQNEGEETDNRVRIFTEFVQERNENFEFKIVNENELSFAEKQVWQKKDKIFDLIGGKPYQVLQVVISETMQKDTTTFMQAAAVWEPLTRRIIIWRPILNNEQKFCGTLLHEVAHATSGATDATRIFESELTRLLGIMGIKAVNHQ